MRKLVRRLAAIPVPAILFALALGLFGLGVYIVLPCFNPWASFAAIVNHPLLRYGVGGFYIFVGATRMAGAVRGDKGWMLKAPYAMMMGYLFLALMNVCVVGWLPLAWVPPAALAVIAGICRLAILYGDAA